MLRIAQGLGCTYICLSPNFFLSFMVSFLGEIIISTRFKVFNLILSDFIHGLGEAGYLTYFFITVINALTKAT